MAILTRAGRAAIAKAIKDMPVHVAWGNGLSSWNPVTPPPEDADAIELIAEVGRRKATSVKFLEPDDDGDIDIVGAGTFSESIVPTNNLLVTARFEFSEGVGEAIRELGVFVGTVPVAGLPSGQVYFEPSEISNPGMLLELEHRAVIFRDATTRQTIEILIVL